jgi:hypothetical protein
MRQPAGRMSEFLLDAKHQQQRVIYKLDLQTRKTQEKSQTYFRLKNLHSFRIT